MRKEKRVGKEFLLPWVKGICVSSISGLAARGQALSTSISPNNGSNARLDLWSRRERGIAFMTSF